MDHQPTQAEERMLIKAYYTDKHTVGRDALYQLLKQRHPVHYPPENTINNWLKRQTVHQLYQITRQPKVVASFRHIKPIHAFAVDF